MKRSKPLKSVLMILLICSGEAIQRKKQLAAHHLHQKTTQRDTTKTRSLRSQGEEDIMIYSYQDENGVTVYETEEMHQRSCEEKTRVLCDHLHHGKLSAKLAGLFSRYYHQIGIKKEYFWTSRATEMLSGKKIEEVLPYLNDAKSSLVSLGNKCGGLNHFTENERPTQMRCNLCHRGCSGLEATEKWFEYALRTNIKAVRHVQNYISGFENAAEAWIKTLEEVRDTSFEVCRACAVAIAVPYAAGMVTTVGGKLVVGTTVGSLTSGTVTAGTEGLKQGLDIAHGLQGEFDWEDYRAAIEESLKKGAVGGAAGVVMSLSGEAVKQLIEKIGGIVFKKLIAAGAHGISQESVVLYLTNTFRSSIRQLVISSYKLYADPAYTHRDMFEDMAYALLVGGVARYFGLEGKFNDIAVADSLLRAAKVKDF